MGFVVDDPEADTLMREVARVHGIDLIDAVKLSAKSLLDHEAEAQARISRIRALQQEFAKIPRTGLKADKDFYDSLNDE